MREFVKKLDNEGQLRTVEREVDPRHELAAVTKASQNAGDHAVLFRGSAPLFNRQGRFFCSRSPYFMTWDSSKL